MLDSCFTFYTKEAAEREDGLYAWVKFNLQAESSIIGRWLNPKGDFSFP